MSPAQPGAAQTMWVGWKFRIPEPLAKFVAVSLTVLTGGESEGGPRPTLLCGGISQASGSIRCDASFGDCDGWKSPNQTGGFLKRQAMKEPCNNFLSVSSGNSSATKSCVRLGVAVWKRNAERPHLRYRLHRMGQGWARARSHRLDHRSTLSRSPTFSGQRPQELPLGQRISRGPPGVAWPTLRFLFVELACHHFRIAVGTTS